MASAARQRQRRDGRLGFRIDASTKALIERAAGIEQRKLTDFCLTALVKAALQIVRDADAIVLSERDRAAFFDALLDAPPPGDRLRRAFANRVRRVAP